jgi:hypothetical protein
LATGIDIALDLAMVFVDIDLVVLVAIEATEDRIVFGTAVAGLARRPSTLVFS